MKVLTGPPSAWGLEGRPRAVTIGVFDGRTRGTGMSSPCSAAGPRSSESWSRRW
jgi:hypothetical protein